jgi:SAM-dependent methyltransferase
VIESHHEHPEVRERLIAWNAARAAAIEDAIARNDRDALREIYEALGEFLEEEARGGEGRRAVLSLDVTNRIIGDLASTTHGQRVLDVGCGPTPVATMAFARSGNATVGVEIAHSLAARARAEAAGLDGARFVVGDAESLPFASGSFDLATCDDTIEHVLDPGRALDELARVVRPGGRLLLISPNHGGLQVLITKWREGLRGRRHPRRSYYVTESHVTEFRWRELRRLLAGRWTVERAYPVGWSDEMVGWKGRVANRAILLGPLWRLSLTLAVLLRRTGTG